jgi:hypothetical protein
MSWEIVVVDGLSDCSNGEFERASDPWLSFAPDGTLHQISLMVNIDDNALFGVSRSAMGVSKSTDGGLTWSEPILIIDDIDPSVINDKETITADPTDANLVYVVWDRLAPVPGSTYMEGPTYFSRTTDGGTTWEAARILYDPGINNQTLNNQIVVLPNGTLLTFFTEIINFPATSFPSYLYVVVSTDQGQTWSRVKRLAPISALGVTTPDKGVPIRAAESLFSVAVDRGNGAVYVVWQESSFTGFDQIALLASMDQGGTWSTPVPINVSPPTPENPRRQQAFLPTVAVANDHTVGVAYYDFRNDDSNGELADRWLIQCLTECTNPANWTAETRLTDMPFDYSQAIYANGLFLGDYVGLAAHDDFLAYVPQSFPADAANGFFRRVPSQIDTNVADSPLVLRPRQQVVSEEPDIGSVWPATLLDVERVNPGMRIAW